MTPTVGTVVADDRVEQERLQQLLEVRECIRLCGVVLKKFQEHKVAGELSSKQLSLAISEVCQRKGSFTVVLTRGVPSVVEKNGRLPIY